MTDHLLAVIGQHARETHTLKGICCGTVFPTVVTQTGGGGGGGLPTRRSKVVTA